MPPRLPRRSRTKAGEFGGAGGYKDFAPSGAFGRSATVSARPVAAGGWAEAVENIWWRGFANVLRLGFATTALRGKAVEGWRNPRRWRAGDDARNSRSVLDCASPLALWRNGCNHLQG